MFNFLREKLPSRGAKAWSMGWQAMTYCEGQDWLSLRIEPMKLGPCQVYVPGAQAWWALAPDFAKQRREELLQKARSTAWNRDLVWLEDNSTHFWHRPVNRPVPGSLESTPGGHELQNMWLFHPESSARWSRQDSKRAWCLATEKMCSHSAGAVNLDPGAIIPGSVFHQVVLPSLRRNPRVTLSLAQAA